MLIVHRHSQLFEHQHEFLQAAAEDDTLILVENAVYLLNELSERYPRLTIRVLKSDAQMRGLSVTDEQALDTVEWVSLSQSNTPWITL